MSSVIDDISLTTYSTFDMLISAKNENSQSEISNNKSKSKRPPNAFLLFCNDHRQQCRDNNPNLKHTEITKILGDKWRSLNSAEKDLYKTESAKKQKEFKEENPEYKYEKTKIKKMNGILPNKQIQVLDVKSLLDLPTSDVINYLSYIARVYPGNFANNSANTHQILDDTFVKHSYLSNNETE